MSSTELQVIEGFEILQNIDEFIIKYPSSNVISISSDEYASPINHMEFNKNDTFKGGSSAYCVGIDKSEFDEKDYFWEIPIDQKDEIVIAFMIKVTDGIESLNSSNILLSFNTDNVMQSYVSGNYSSYGSLEFRDGDDNIEASSGVNSINRDEWVFVEISYKLDQTNGSFKMKANGLELINYENSQTKTFGGPDYINNIRFHLNFGGEDGGFYLDDFFVLNSLDFIGYKHVEAILPTANGSNNDWIASSGSNFDQVNDLTPNSSNFVSSDTSGDIDLYEMGDLSRIKSGVVGYQINIRSEATPDANIRTKAKFGSSTEDGESNLVSSDNKVVREIIETKPGSSQKLNVDDVNNTEIGMENI